MKKVIPFLLIIFSVACTEKLIKSPENLISKEKMVLILNDLAIANAAKANNAVLLRQNDIEPTAYIFKKYDIDSIQFVESDRYYASIPEEHEEIYTAVELKLETEKERITLVKKRTDSIKALKKKAATKEKTIDSQLKNVDKKK